MGLLFFFFLFCFNAFKEMNTKLPDNESVNYSTSYFGLIKAKDSISWNIVIKILVWIAQRMKMTPPRISNHTDQWTTRNILIKLLLNLIYFSVLFLHCPRFQIYRQSYLYTRKSSGVLRDLLLTIVSFGFIFIA